MNNLKVLGKGKSNFSALTIIDEMIGHQARGGPGGEVVLSFNSVNLPSYLNKYVKILGLELTTFKGKEHYKLIGGMSCYDALYLTRSVYEALYDNLPKFMTFPIEEQLDFYVQSRNWPTQMFVKFAKYITVWPMARYLHQDLPQKPSGFEGSGLVFRGHIKRLLKSRLVALNDKNTRLWLTYLQGVKRGAAVVSKDFIQSSMVAHRTSLMTPPTTSEDVIRSYDRYVERALSDFWPPYKSLKLHEASSSASYESKRSEGGARQFMMDHLVYGDSKEKLPYASESLINMVEVSPGHVVEMRGLWTPRLDDFVTKSDPQDGSVEVSAVCEPLKVRLISKGNAFNYYVSKDFQKKMWSYLQKYDQFSLTGRPMDASDLHGILIRERNLNLSFDKWVSGDYSAATDGVDYRLTKKFFEVMLRRADYPKELEKVLWKVIGLQEIHYPNSYNKNGTLDPIQQANGQLMGSPLSFPLLCLINLIAYWSALEQYLGRPIKMRDLPVLINGDDILFRANDGFYVIWKEKVAECGFKLSVGKNYIHKSLLTINSKMYRYIIGTDGRPDFRLIPFLNCGLLTGQSKITGREVHRMLPVWSLYNKTVPEAADKLRAHRRFIHYHKQLIIDFTGSTKNRVGGNFNLFLPSNRGGLGFDLVIPRTEYRITSFQRRYATYLENCLRAKVLKGEEPTGSSIGMIRKDQPLRKSLLVHHNPALVLVPSVGPLENNLISFEPRKIDFPILSVKNDPERPEYFVRQPFKLLRDFRGLMISPERMSTKKILSWPWRLVEKVNISQDVCTTPQTVPSKGDHLECKSSEKTSCLRKPTGCRKSPWGPKTNESKTVIFRYGESQYFRAK